MGPQDNDANDLTRSEDVASAASRTEAQMDFRTVYDKNFLFVWRSLRRLGVPEADAQDAAQEVFLVVMRRLPEFEGRAKITTWLFRICFRIASERSRRAHVRREVRDEELGRHADPAADTSAPAEQREALDVLEATLDAMELGQRAVFTLFELEGLSGEDIAQSLGIPLGTVYSRLRLARDVFHKTVARRNLVRSPALARAE